MVAPFVVALGMTPTAVRLAYLFASLALIPLAYFLGRALDRDAALPAALLVVCPSTYFLGLAVFPLPFYPTVLVLHGLLFLGATAIVEERRRIDGHVVGLAVAWGIVAGVALWTHLMSLSILVVCAIYIFLARARGRWPELGLLAVIPAAAIASAPLWHGLLTTPAARAVTSVWNPDETAPHLAQLMPHLHEPILALMGVRVSLSPDDTPVDSPWALSILLIVAYALLLVIALRAGWRRAVVRMLVLAVVLVCAAFLLALRSTPDTARFLTPAYLPLTALAALGIARARPARLGRYLLAGIMLLNAIHGARLWLEWCRHQSIEPLLPDCRPVIELLRSRGIRRAWASYNMAYCVTYTSGEQIVASQPLNERFPGYPLPYADEVRFAHEVAWVFHPSGDFNLLSPERFEARLASSGAGWRRTNLDNVVVFDEFIPPFSPEVIPFASEGAAADGDIATNVIEPGQHATVFPLERPTALAGLTLLGSPRGPTLPSGMSIEVSLDGKSYVRVARLRSGLRQTEIVWLNGQPQLRMDDAAVSIPLSGVKVSALRIRPAPPQDSWALAELLLHPRSEDASWDDWLSEDLPWHGRQRALDEWRRRDRADWYYRSLLVARRPVRKWRILQWP